MENIKQLLELNIEIEGLLRVAEYRRSDTVVSLLLAKSKKFLDLLNADIAYSKSPQDTSIGIQSDVNSHPVSNIAAEEIVSDGTYPNSAGISDETSNITEGIPELVSEEIETVLEADIRDQENIECPPSGNPAPPIFSSPSLQNDSKEAESPTELSPAKETSSESNHLMRIDEMIHRQSSRDLKKAFSLNDRFRYIREIFENDANYFDETIKNLDLLSNLDEVYDYLLGDIGLNHDDETVKDFLAIIYNHFNA